MKSWRERWRRSKSRCPRCGYPEPPRLATSSVTTGTPLRVVYGAGASGDASPKEGGFREKLLLLLVGFALTGVLGQCVSDGLGKARAREEREQAWRASQVERATTFARVSSELGQTGREVQWLILDRQQADALAALPRYDKAFSAWAGQMMEVDLLLASLPGEAGALTKELREHLSKHVMGADGCVELGRKSLEPLRSRDAGHAKQPPADSEHRYQEFKARCDAFGNYPAMRACGLAIAEIMQEAPSELEPQRESSLFGGCGGWSPRRTEPYVGSPRLKQLRSSCLAGGGDVK